MLKHRLAAVAAITALLSLPTHATQPTPQPSTVNAPSARAGALALAGSASLSTSASTSAGGSVLGSGNGTSQVLGSGNSTYNAAPVSGGTVDLAGAKIGSDVTLQRSVASAFAAPLAASNGTCSGSSSAGAQGASFGVSIGSTWTDGGCDARYDAQALAAMGMRKAAIARLCAKPEIAKAMEAEGDVCPKTAEAKRAEAILNDRPTASTQKLPMPWQAGG